MRFTPFPEVWAQRTAYGVALFGVGICLVIPPAMGAVLVLLGLSAAAAGLVVSHRGAGVERRAWLLFSAGQALGALSALAISAASPAAGLLGVGWGENVISNAATGFTVLGLAALVLPARRSRLLGVVAIDLMLVLSSAFIVGWMWDLPHRFGGSAQTPNVVGIADFLALVLDFIGIGLVGWIWNSRPKHQRSSVRLVAIAIVVATLGDAGVFAAALQMSIETACLAWAISSALFLVAATHVPRKTHRTVTLGERLFLDLATISCALTIVSVVVAGGPDDDVTKAVLVVLMVTLLARHFHSARTNLNLSTRLIESERYYRGLIQSSQDVIVVVRDGGRISYASPAASQLFGLASGDLAGIDVATLLSERDESRIRDELDPTKESGSGRVEFDIGRPDGTTRQAEALVSRCSDGYIFSVRDVTERSEMMRRIEEAARRDALTGLANRFGFEEALQALLETAGAASLILCDLDGFKQVNDTSGHGAGDEILRQVARRLEAAMPGTLVARFGGDEFAVLLPRDISYDGAMAMTGHVQNAVNQRYRVVGKEVFLTLTAGLAYSQTGAVSESLRNADLALYEAKAAGQGQARVFDQSMLDRAMHRVEMDERLRAALKNGELSLRYQPVVDLRTGRIVSVEALVRWITDDGEVLAPQDLIELAETTGCIADLGEWVLRAAIAQLAEWASEGVNIPVAVNVSAGQLLNGDLAGLIQQLLHDAGVSPELLALEITETVFLDDVEAVIATLNRLRGLGTRIAIDDFGTGYSCFAYLSRIPIDELKIDRLFVAGIADCPTRLAIVRTMTTVSHELGLAVTAEGVETEEQLAALDRLGVEHIQGFLVGRPIPATELLDLVREREVQPVRVGAPALSMGEVDSRAEDTDWALERASVGAAPGSLPKPQTGHLDVPQRRLSDRV